LFDHSAATHGALSSVLAEDEEARDWALDEVERRHGEILEVLHLEVLAGARTIDAARIERFRRLLEGFGSATAADRAAVWAQRYRAAYQGARQPVPGAQALLTAARREGWRVAIVTNNLRAEQLQKMESCGFTGDVDELVTSEEVGVSKPDRRIFEVALERLGVDPSQAVMLGDGWATDVEGARACGIRAVWFNRRGVRSPDPGVVEVHSLSPADAVLAVLAGPEP
jgi:putative hydrolase of the HAD superfamily